MAIIEWERHDGSATLVFTKVTEGKVPRFDVGYQVLSDEWEMIPNLTAEETYPLFKLGNQYSAWEATGGDGGGMGSS